MSRVERAAARVRRSAEREHSGDGTHRDRRRSDSDAAAAHPVLTETKLRKGHPQTDDGPDEPVGHARDGNVASGGIEGEARRRRGRA